MESAMALNSLCKVCQPIFEGHWTERSKLKAHMNKKQESGSSIRLSGSDFYERPDWVKVSMCCNNDEEKELSYDSPKHHSTVRLQDSARMGCHLCTMIWDQIYYHRESMDLKDRESLDASLGVVTCRPQAGYNTDNESEQDGREELILEVSYIIGGRYEIESDFVLMIHFEM